MTPGVLNWTNIVHTNPLSPRLITACLGPRPPKTHIVRGEPKKKAFFSDQVPLGRPTPLAATTRDPEAELLKWGVFTKTSSTSVCP